MYRVYYCDHYPIPLPPGHKFPIRKYALVRNFITGQDKYDLRPAPLASVDELDSAHDSAYVRSVLDGSVDPGIMRRIGFPWPEQLVRRSLASVGGTLAAARDALV